MIYALILGFSLGHYGEAQGSQQLLRPQHDQRELQAFLKDRVSDSSANLGVLSSEQDRKRLLRMLGGAEFFDLWETEARVIGLARCDGRDFCFFAWSKLGEQDSETLIDSLRIYLDERLSKIEDQKSLEKWEENRAFIVGSMLDAKKQRLEVEAFGPAHFEYNWNGLDQQYLSPRPVFVRFRPSEEERPLLSSKSKAPNQN